jgi:hypothetical protein
MEISPVEVRAKIEHLRAKVEEIPQCVTRKSCFVPFPGFKHRYRRQYSFCSKTAFIWIDEGKVFFHVRAVHLRIPLWRDSRWMQNKFFPGNDKHAALRICLMLPVPLQYYLISSNKCQQRYFHFSGPKRKWPPWNSYAEWSADGCARYEGCAVAPPENWERWIQFLRNDMTLAVRYASCQRHSLPQVSLHSLTQWPREMFLFSLFGAKTNLSARRQCISVSGKLRSTWWLCTFSSAHCAGRHECKLFNIGYDETVVVGNASCMLLSSSHKSTHSSH